MTDVWTTLLGDKLVTKDGEQATSKVLDGKKVVGLYFSAHWCPPCRAFTPTLSATYEDLVEEHPEFELIFISSDREEAGFAGYYSDMPFKALPYALREKKVELGAKFEIKFIPALVFLNEKGEVITKHGQELVADAQGDVEALWTKLTDAQQQKL